MAELFIPLFFKTLKDILAANPVIAEQTAGRININEYNPNVPEELPAINIYEDNDSRFDSGLGRQPDTRKLTFQIEVLVSNNDNGELFRGLNLLCEAVEAVIDNPPEDCLEGLDKAFTEAGRSDVFFQIKWENTDFAVIIGSERQIGTAVLQFFLEYEKRPISFELPDFREAHTDWGVMENGEGPVIEAENIATMEE